MALKPRENGKVELGLSLDQLKRVYVALFCHLQTGGCTAADDLDDDLLLKLQTYLQGQAAAQGVDCTNHADWEEFLGITHPQSCPRREPTPTAGRIEQLQPRPPRLTHRDIIAVFQGSFDPVTFGHLDVIRRAARLFNQLIVGIGQNPDKQQLFTPQERLELLLPHIADLANVRAASYDGLTIDFVRECRAHVLVRGIRDMADLNHEVQIANLNRLVGAVETVFILTSDQYVLTSSTYIRQIYEMGGGDITRVEQLVPPNVAQRLAEKLEAPPGRPRPRARPEGK
jgi:pantetheine-phosphate adenylyltransferase